MPSGQLTRIFTSQTKYIPKINFAEYERGNSQLNYNLEKIEKNQKGFKETFDNTNYKKNSK